MSETTKRESKDLFESRLIDHLLNQVIKKGNFEGCNIIANRISEITQKNVKGQTVHFMSIGQGYGKKWMVEALLKWSLATGWMPSDIKDWEHVIWTIMGKKQSARGGDNSIVYRTLADWTEKPEFIFENNYRKILEGDYD